MGSTKGNIWSPWLWSPHAGNRTKSRTKTSRLVIESRRYCYFFRGEPQRWHNNCVHLPFCLGARLWKEVRFQTDKDNTPLPLMFLQGLINDSQQWKFLWWDRFERTFTAISQGSFLYLPLLSYMIILQIKQPSSLSAACNISKEFTNNLFSLWLRVSVKYLKHECGHGWHNSTVWLTKSESLVDSIPEVRFLIR